MTDLRTFADGHRLKVRRDDDNTRIIPGKVGHIWDYGDGLFGVTLLELTPKKWTYRRNACLRVGMGLHQDGDDEGTLLFDPSNEAQVGVALKVAHVKKRRVPSEAQLEVLARARESSPVVRRSTESSENARGRPDMGLGKGRGSSEEKAAQVPPQKAA